MVVEAPLSEMGWSRHAGEACAPAALDVTMSLKACLCSSELAFHNSMRCFWDLRLSPSKKAWILAFHTISDSRFFLAQACGGEGSSTSVAASGWSADAVSAAAALHAGVALSTVQSVASVWIAACMVSWLSQHAKQQPITGLLLSWVISSEQRMQWVAFAFGSFKHLLFRET